MRDQGLPIVDAAPACPFVALEDDREARAGGPDHRHRCFAEVRAAPRALAHQEAYCLSSAFPACPTFQDWARREAAAVVDGAPGATPDAGTAGADGPRADTNRRNPPRDWAAPPPWLNSGRPPARTSGGPGGRGAIQGALDAEAADDAVSAPPPGGGLSGSFADRIVSGAGDPFTERAALPGPSPIMGAPEDDDVVAGADDEEIRPVRPSSIPRHLGAGPSGREHGERPPGGRRPTDPGAPPWERPRRFESYPTLRSRVGLPRIGGSSLLLGVVAVAIAAVALFVLPGIIGIGDDGPAASGTPTASASPAPSAPDASTEPSLPAEPTGTVYIVEPGDTMSKIANKFDVPLALLIEANKTTIPDPDTLQIGDQVIIPALTPTSVPGASEAPSPSP